MSRHRRPGFRTLVRRSHPGGLTPFNARGPLARRGEDLTPREPTREPNGTLWFGEPISTRTATRSGSGSPRPPSPGCPATRGSNGCGVKMDTTLASPAAAELERGADRAPPRRGLHRPEQPPGLLRGAPPPDAGERGDGGGRGTAPARRPRATSDRRPRRGTAGPGSRGLLAYCRRAVHVNESAAAAPASTPTETDPSPASPATVAVEEVDPQNAPQTNTQQRPSAPRADGSVCPALRLLHRRLRWGRQPQ